MRSEHDYNLEAGSLKAVSVIKGTDYNKPQSSVLP
jgi:hypothetical protein